MLYVIKMLWKNVWVVSFYYHFKDIFGEKKGTTEWREGGVDFCVNTSVDIFLSVAFLICFALVVCLAVRNNSCGNSSSWKFLMFFINIVRVLVFAADFNLFNCVFVSLNLAPWHLPSITILLNFLEKFLISFFSFFLKLLRQK